MNYQSAKDYLLTKPESVEDYPFGPDVAVLKVCGKMFAALVMNDGEWSMNLKSDPHEALALREIFDAVAPGYHMNKKHWNTITLNGSIPRGEIERMMDNSYALVLGSLTKKKRNELIARFGAEQLGLV